MNRNSCTRLSSFARIYQILEKINEIPDDVKTIRNRMSDIILLLWFKYPQLILPAPRQPHGCVPRLSGTEDL